MAPMREWHLVIAHEPTRVPQEFKTFMEQARQFLNRFEFLGILFRFLEKPDNW